MQESSKSLRFRYVLFVVSVVLTLVITQAIIQYDLSQQNSDAQLINLAGRQRMLSQRVSKLTLFLYYNKIKNKETGYYRLDSLQTLTDHWEKIHYYLIESNKETRKSQAIDSLFKINTPFLKQMVTVIHTINERTTPEELEEAINKISQVELPFLLIMEKIVATYQREAELKLHTLKVVELVLSCFAFVILMAEFAFIILPILRKLRKSNENLAEMNAEIQASEEEVRSSLEQITELQNNLEIRQLQYQSLIDDASDIIYELSAKGEYSFISPVAELVTGFSKDELIGKSFTTLMHPEDREHAIAFYEQQRASLTEVTYLEFRILTKRKEVVWIGQNVKMFFDDKWVYKATVVARDITNIKNIESRLLNERILLRTIIDNIPINIYAKNTKSEKILANRAEFEYVGAKSEGEIIGMNDVEMYPQESSSISLKEDDLVLKGNSIINQETLNVRKDGSETWFLISKVPLRNDLGEITGLVGFSIDVTERKMVQEELKRKEELYRLVSENSQDVVSLHDLDRNFTYISPSCIDLHGYPPETFIGLDGSQFIYEEDLQFMIDDFPTIVEKMKNNILIEPIQFRLKTKHRGLVWVENLIKPVFRNGELSGFQSTLRDISMRKRYEEELQSARYEAESATNAKGQFLSTMSHEIRTPLNGIVGLTNILIGGNPRQDQAEHLGLLKFSCDNLLTIINDILDFSKIESGKMELENIPFNLPEIVEYYKKIADDRAKQKGIELVLTLDPKLPAFVLGDPVRLGQILNNLISNAIKFTEKGFVHISVYQLNVAEKVGSVLFVIKDTGIGIPAEKVDTIFEGFSQASSDTTRKFGGTGLGLSITKRLLDLMGSSVKVKSQLGQGSEFSFELALVEAEPDAAFREIEEISDAPNLLIKLLLVEDNDINQVVAKRFLNQWGIETEVAENGKEAIVLVLANRYDIILMDIQMPVMDGYEATKIIRSYSEAYFKTVPIIALTADVSSEIKKRANDAGMNDLINKPFKPNELLSIIRKHISVNVRNDVAPVSFPKLEVYTKGDPGFKIEFVNLLIKNLNELKAGMEWAITENDWQAFDHVLHKCKTALTIIDDDHLQRILQQIKLQTAKTNSLPQNLLDGFLKCYNDLILKLKQELS